MNKIKKNLYWPLILSRHSTHNVLRKSLEKLPKKSVIRLGSTTVLPDDNIRIHINKIEAIRNSSSKLKMKQCFTNAGIKTTDWWITKDGKTFNSLELSEKSKNINNLPYPIIAKGIFGSRGKANTKLDDCKQLENWLKNKNLDNYIFEAFFDGTREYRFHISNNGVFLTWRKLRRNDTPKNQRWFFNNQNCNWVSEKHELYNKPTSYNKIGEECVKALKAVGLDIGGCDVRVNKKGDFKIIEINSACSLATVTAEAYKKELTILLKNKLK